MRPLQLLTILMGSLLLAACTAEKAANGDAARGTQTRLPLAGLAGKAHVNAIELETPDSAAVAGTGHAYAAGPAAAITETAAPRPSSTPQQVATLSEVGMPLVATPEAITFAAVGDYGWSGPGARAVAALVDGRDPDLVITLGDNNYPDGAAWSIAENITANYGRFIEDGRFFPTLGNHDLTTDHGQPYFDYFELPGNERYYDFVRGDVHFFAVNSDWREPDGIHADSAQAEWLRERLLASTSDWQVVYFHAPPFVSMWTWQVPVMDWPFADWGADLVLSGHAHLYERLQVGDLTYIVNGLGGFTIYRFDLIPRPESVARYNRDFGVLFVKASAGSLHGQFVTHDGAVIDEWTVMAAVQGD